MFGCRHDDELAGRQSPVVARINCVRDDRLVALFRETLTTSVIDRSNT
ncbi:hypothetical protein [Kribbella sp. NBC_00889]|nr:hypothetical protein OG817_13070 [Kribbella sp. NBC_00889]